MLVEFHQVGVPEEIMAVDLELERSPSCEREVYLVLSVKRLLWRSETRLPGLHKASLHHLYVNC